MRFSMDGVYFHYHIVSDAMCEHNIGITIDSSTHFFINDTTSETTIGTNWGFLEITQNGFVFYDYSVNRTYSFLIYY